MVKAFEEAQYCRMEAEIEIFVSRWMRENAHVLEEIVHDQGDDPATPYGAAMQSYLGRNHLDVLYEHDLSRDLTAFGRSFRNQIQFNITWSETKHHFHLRRMFDFSYQNWTILKHNHLYFQKLDTI